MMKSRIKKLREYLDKEDVDAILISSVPHVEYLTNFYNFSKEERDVYLLITKNKNYLITSILYAEAFKNKKWDFTLREISAKSRTKETLEKIRDDGKIKTLAIEEEDIKVREYKSFKKIFKNLESFNFPHLRTNKTNQEIEFIQKACAIGDKVFSEICKKLKEGISEKEVALQIKLLALKYGADDISFSTIVAFGENSAVPHHQVGDKKLTTNGEIILVDFGMKVAGYCSDMTRTVFLGEPNEKQKKIYQAVLGSQQKAIDYIKETLIKRQMPISSKIFEAANNFIKKSGFSDIPHGLGHGIGLEVHEHPHISPSVEYELEEGMVFSIEPGIYISRFGGVRIEDLYTIQNKKLIELTKSAKQLLEL